MIINHLQPEKSFLNLRKKWIILQFAKIPSPSTVRRECILHCKISGKGAKSYQLIQFTRVIDHFSETSSETQEKTSEYNSKKNRSSDSGGEEFLWRNSQLLTQKSFSADFTHQTTLWKIVRHGLWFRFYHYTSVQPLTDAHKAQRRQFCQWILQQPSSIVDRIIWTDEKFFWVSN